MFTRKLPLLFAAVSLALVPACDDKKEGDKKEDAKAGADNKDGDKKEEAKAEEKKEEAKAEEKKEEEADGGW